MLEVDRALLGLGIDEADEVDPVLRMLEELAADQLADVPGADDDRVLEVREPAVAQNERADGAPHARSRAMARSQKSVSFVKSGFAHGR